MNKYGNLSQAVDEINSKDDFASFVQALANDLSTNQSEWENASLERYLNAIAAWSQNIDNYYRTYARRIRTSGDLICWRK